MLMLFFIWVIQRHSSTKLWWRGPPRGERYDRAICSVKFSIAKLRYRYVFYSEKQFRACV